MIYMILTDRQGSVDRVLVTFPEPPAQHDHQEQGDHLLDADFAASVYRLLVSLDPRGLIYSLLLLDLEREPPILP